MNNKIICFIIFLAFNAFAQEQPHLYIMLNVDKTIVDRVENCDIEAAQELKEHNIHVQKLKYIANDKNSKKFLNIYRKLANKEKISNEPNYMHKIIVNKINEQKFEITECLAVRPTLSVLVYQLTHLKIPTTILLTSRNDDVRTENVRNNLQVQIYGKTFAEIITVVPRDYFHIKEKGISVKSAKELRKNLQYIKENDFVIMLDHLEDKRFIKSNPKRDLNIFVPIFSIDKKYNYDQDEKEIMSTISKINKFIKK